MSPVPPRRLGAGLALGAAGALAAAALAGASITPAGGFGHHGTVDLGSGKVLAVAAQKDGGVVAVGYSGKRMLVALVSSQGRVRKLSAGDGIANAVAVQSDGRIVVAGTTAPSGHTPLAGNMVVERFTQGGSVDRGFGRGGRVVLRGAVANAVATGSGEIVAGGSTPGGDGSPRLTLARLGGNGAPSSGFGSGGVSVVDLGPYSVASALQLQSGGRIVFAGSAGLQVVNAIVGRVSASGRLDRSFASHGVYTYEHPRGGAFSSFQALASDSRGRLVLAGEDAQNSGPHALFVRLSSRGAPDGGFGARGVFTTAALRGLNAGNLAGALGLALTRGGEVLGVGSYEAGAQTLAAIWSVSSRGALDRRGGGATTTTLSSTVGAAFHSVVQEGSEMIAGGESDGRATGSSRAVLEAFSLQGFS